MLSFQLFICSLAFATFTVDLVKPENRLQLSFILLLTTITFKFVVSQNLPRISYLTYLVSKFFGIIINVLFQLFICSLAFATFTVDLTKPQNRLQLSFILLLTTITFKFVVSQTLPRISYLTYLVSNSLFLKYSMLFCPLQHSLVPS